MTFRQIYFGLAIGGCVIAARFYFGLPSFVVNVGLLVMIGSIIAGGVDGTLPRTMT